MNGTWNFKLFISISLGLHFFVFSLLSILLPDFKITQLPRLNIEVSLLPIIKEEREPLRKVEDRSKVQSSPARQATSSAGGEFGLQPIRAYGPEGVRSEEVEIKTEAHAPVKTHEERKVSQVEKIEITLPQKELEPVSTSPVQGEVRVVSVNEPKPSLLENEKKEIRSKQEERVVIASLGNPFPQTSSSETPRVAIKSPSLSEGEVILAQPRYAENPKPLYPREARKKGYEGEVLLRVEVLSNGRVGEIEVRRSSGHEVLDRSAISAVKQWKFVPAKKGETPVPGWVNIPVAFELR